MDTLLDSIFKDDKMIYFLSGSKKQELLETFDEDYDDVLKITKDTITHNSQNDSIDAYLSKITVKFLITKHFVMDLSEFNLLNDAELKSFLHNEYAAQAYFFLNIPTNNETNKLFVLINDTFDIRNLSESILSRTRFIDTDHIEKFEYSYC